MPKISLIIPVYNSELYLKEALDSVLNQTFKDFEVIAINDGSTDSSLEILKEYEGKFKDFTIINQENKGLGKTRNIGIKTAKCEYISFLDSDDFITCDYLEKLYNLIKNNDADISCCNFKIYSKNRLNFDMPLASKSCICTKEKALKKLILDVSIHHFSWGKLYKRSIFEDNNIEFYNMYFEDVATCPKVFFFANKIVITNEALYYYRRHRASIISSMNSSQINDLAVSVGILRTFLENQNIYKKYKKQFQTYSLRIGFQINFLILYKHIRHWDFIDFSKNFKKAWVLFKLFRENNFQLTGDPPMLPFYLKIPNKKKVYVEKLEN